MTVPEMTLVPHRDFDARAARRITERIRSSMGDIMADIAKAHMGRVWIALGYESWAGYIKGEFNYAPLSLPRDERRAVVSLLRGQGMSTRAIASVTGTSAMTISRDAASGVSNVTPEPSPRNDQSGECIHCRKTLPLSQLYEGGQGYECDPCVAPEGPLGPLDVEFDEEPAVDEPVAAEPAKITGLDGRSYPSSRPQPPAVAVQPAPAQTVTCPTCGGTGKVNQ